MLFIWNVAPVVSASVLAGLYGLTATAAVLEISDITKFFHYDKSSSVSQSIKSKPGNL